MLLVWLLSTKKMSKSSDPWWYVILFGDNFFLLQMLYIFLIFHCIPFLTYTPKIRMSAGGLKEKFVNEPHTPDYCKNTLNYNKSYVNVNNKTYSIQYFFEYSPHRACIDFPLLLHSIQGILLSWPLLLQLWVCMPLCTGSWMSLNCWHIAGSWGPLSPRFLHQVLHILVTEMRKGI